MRTRILITILISFYSLSSISQNGFHFSTSKKKKEYITFQLINNLIVIPIEVNGESLSFILDTGVNKTILFDPTQKDSIHFLSTENNSLRGLGKGESLQTITSANNTLKIKNIISYHENIHITINSPFDFSKKMGITIHGIIGYSLFKNFIVKINYQSKKITFYNPDRFTYKNCRKCVTKSLQFKGNKPYIDTQISLDTIDNKMIDVKLLIDSGGSDAMWLFENSSKDIVTPNQYFNDVLGEGLSGQIYGKRSRLSKFKLGGYEITNPTVSFLDSTSTNGARKFKSRNGSIGGRILKRFTIWFDYSNKKVTFQKKASFLSDFNYNMSGLDIVYNGMELVLKKEFVSLANSTSSDTNVFMYNYKFRPSYAINNVVINSPAYIAGLLKDDVILKINHKYVTDLTLEDIFYKLQEKDKKKIKMTIKRNGKKMKFEFKLKKEI